MSQTAKWVKNHPDPAGRGCLAVCEIGPHPDCAGDWRIFNITLLENNLSPTPAICRFHYEEGLRDGEVLAGGERSVPSVAVEPASEPQGDEAEPKEVEDVPGI